MLLAAPCNIVAKQAPANAPLLYQGGLHYTQAHCPPPQAAITDSCYLEAAGSAVNKHNTTPAVGRALKAGR